MIGAITFLRQLRDVCKEYNGKGCENCPLFPTCGAVLVSPEAAEDIELRDLVAKTEQAAGRMKLEKVQKQNRKG